MRAAVLDALGGVPACGDHPDPAPPGDDEVLVRVTAAPIVPLDLLCASGTSYFGARRVPYVPGVQGVGEVVEGGGLAPGTRVFVATTAGMVDGDGAMAELVVVPASGVVALPREEADVDDVALAALGLSAVAAWQALGWRAGLEPGEDVVVLGAGGAVGQAAIGAARAQGARRVVAVCRAGASAARARTQDPDEVVEVEAPDVPGLTAALRAVLPGGAHVVLDPVFGWVAEAALGAMAPGGAAGQPRRLRRGRGDAVLGGAAGPRARAARLHQQRAQRHAAGRRPARGGAAGRAGRDRRGAPGPTARGGRRGLALAALGRCGHALGAAARDLTRPAT